MNRQRQSGGDNSTNIQASVVHVGLSLDDVKAVVRDEVRPMFEEMSKRAAGIATERAVEVAELLVDRLAMEKPSALEAATDPDFQHALITAQREYARSGDPELRDLLVDVLIDRANYEGGGFVQTVLNESLSVAPKLTADQLAGLTAMFLGSRVRSNSVTNLQALSEWVETNFEHLVDRLPVGRAWFGHLQYVGCVQSAFIALPDLLIKNIAEAHPGLFQKGLTDDQVARVSDLLGGADVPLIPCISNADLRQFSSLNTDVLEQQLLSAGVEDDARSKLADEYFMKQLLPLEQAQAKIEEHWPPFRVVADWLGEQEGYQLTSIGVAIAHTNWTRLTGNRADLAVWIN